jgi:hypothetical protein
LSALPILALGFSAIAKISKADAVIQGMVHYGYPEHLIPVLGVVELLVAIIYAVPRTAFIGTILITGYLGGATATNVRVERSILRGDGAAGSAGMGGAVFARWPAAEPDFRPPWRSALNWRMSV